MQAVIFHTVDPVTFADIFEMRTKGKDFIQIGYENWFQHCTNPVATENSGHILKLKTNDLQSNTQKRHGNQTQMRPA